MKPTAYSGQRTGNEQKTEPSLAPPFCLRQEAHRDLKNRLERLFFAAR